MATMYENIWVSDYLRDDANINAIKDSFAATPEQLHGFKVTSWFQYFFFCLPCSSAVIHNLFHLKEPPRPFNTLPGKPYIYSLYINIYIYIHKKKFLQNPLRLFTEPVLTSYRNHSSLCLAPCQGFEAGHKQLLPYAKSFFIYLFFIFFLFFFYFFLSH